MSSEGRGGHIWFSGDYSSWDLAARDAAGYDSPNILDKVLAATLKVKSGEAACERDSVTFDRPEYSLPLLASLLYVASRLRNRLIVLDFGGSLGSSFWQNRRFLAHLERLRWLIVEQLHFVEAGQTHLATDSLRFFESVEDCLTEETPDVILLSGVVQYLPNPHGLLTSLFETGTQFVILDRTPFFLEDLPDRITIERVHPAIYEGSYPAWFFNLGQFRQFLGRSSYGVLEDFDSWEAWDVDGHKAQNKCFLLERRRT